MKMNKKVELLEALETMIDFRKDEYKIEYPLHEIILSMFRLFLVILFVIVMG